MLVWADLRWSAHWWTSTICPHPRRSPKQCYSYAGKSLGGSCGTEGARGGLDAVHTAHPLHPHNMCPEVSEHPTPNSRNENLGALRNLLLCWSQDTLQESPRKQPTKMCTHARGRKQNRKEMKTPIQGGPTPCGGSSGLQSLLALPLTCRMALAWRTTKTMPEQAQDRGNVV